MAIIDKDWFFKKLTERERSLRGLARHMKIDPSAVSRMFSGERRMQMDEVVKIASFLGVSASEVLVHAGVSLRPDEVWRDGGGRVVLRDDDTPAPAPAFSTVR